jgi:hypothetical protein
MASIIKALRRLNAYLSWMNKERIKTMVDIKQGLF